MSVSWMRLVRLVCGVAGLVVVAATMSGCASLPGASFDLSSGFLGLPSSEPGKPKTLAELKQVHIEKPHDTDAAISYSRALKANGRGQEALRIVETAAGSRPDDQQLVVEQGLLALELGQTAKAQHALLRASPATKDWKVLSGLGVAHAGVGQHAKAQDYFNRALELSPGNPTVLNNLALSYLLDKKIDKGRELLAQATAAGGDKPQIARNLELAMALKGGAKTRPAAGGGTASAIAKAPQANGGTAMADAKAGPATTGPVRTPLAQTSTSKDAPAEKSDTSTAAASSSVATAGIDVTVAPAATTVTAEKMEKSAQAAVPPQILRFGGLLHDR